MSTTENRRTELTQMTKDELIDLVLEREKTISIDMQWIEKDAQLLRKMRKIRSAAEAIIQDSEARPGAYTHVRGLDQLRAALIEEAEERQQQGAGE